MLIATDLTKLKYPYWKRLTSLNKDDSAKYIHRFSVYSYNKMPILSGVFVFDEETNEVIVDVRNEKDNTPYAPYYYYYYGDYEPILAKIKRKINIELKKYGIIERNK